MSVELQSGDPVRIADRVIYGHHADQTGIVIGSVDGPEIKVRIDRRAHGLMIYAREAVVTVPADDLTALPAGGSSL
jgi:hypothetical protein